MSFVPVKRLTVWRTRTDGSRCRVGTLAQNRQGVFFAYDPGYLSDGGNLSPFKLDFASALQPAPRAPHQGLHGVFADSIPDGWGLLLMDRVFRQAGILPARITAMDRLAFVGESGMGALSYEPVSAFSQADDGALLRVDELGLRSARCRLPLTQPGL